MMRESQIEQLLRSECKQRNALVFKWVSPGQRGVPDDIVIWPDGRLDFVELKTSGGSLTSMQRYQLDRLTKAGQTCYVLRGEIGVQMYLRGGLKPWD